MAESHTIDKVHGIHDADRNSLSFRRFFWWSFLVFALSGTGYLALENSKLEDALGTATAISGAFTTVALVFALNEYLQKQRLVDEVRSHARENGIILDFPRWLRTGRSEF